VCSSDLTDLNFKFNQYLTVTSNVSYNWVNIRYGKFDTKEYGFWLITNFTPKLNARTFVQWNNESKLANINFRIHFIPKVGSDVYFVYNHLFDGYNNYDTLYNVGIAKIAYQVTF
jgi:hypothetical protein